MADSTRFSRRMSLGFVLAFLILLPVVAASLYSLDEIGTEKRTRVHKHYDALLIAEKVRANLNQQRALMPIFVLTGDRGIIEGFRQAHREFGPLLSELETATGQRFVLLRQFEQELYDAAAPGISARLRGHPAAEVNKFFESRARPVATKTHQLMEAILRDRVAVLGDAKEESEVSAAQIVRGLIGVSLLALVALAAILWFLRREIALREELFRREAELSRARKETVEVVAHDLKSPLATVIMSLDLAQQEAEGEARRLIEMSLRAARKMNEFILALLDHSKIEAGHLELETAPRDPLPLLTELAGNFRALAQDKRIVLETDLPADLGFVPFDEIRLRQVLCNLLGNALKFTPGGGTVLLKAERRGDDVVVSVHDNGTGIEATALPHVFDRYWQVRATAKNGTGLGLAISKGIIEAHGGKIWAESQTGRGSIFSLSLPRSFAG